MNQMEYFYCETCGEYFSIDTHIHDVHCPECDEGFLDGNIEHITKEEYEDIIIIDYK